MFSFVSERHQREISVFLTIEKPLFDSLPSLQLSFSHWPLTKENEHNIFLELQLICGNSHMYIPTNIIRTYLHRAAQESLAELNETVN